MIVVGQWYRFKNQKDKDAWLKLVNEKADIDDISFFKDKKLLSLKQYSNGKYTIHYRTDDNWKYDGDSAVTYEPENLIEQERNKFASLVKEQNIFNAQYLGIKTSGKETQKTMKLINIAENEVMSKLSKEYQEKRWDFISKETVSGKAIITLCETLNKQKDVSIKPQDIFSEYMLTDIDTEKLNNISKEYNEILKKSENKFTELKELYNLTETYEQRIALLKQYKILKEV